MTEISQGTRERDVLRFSESHVVFMSIESFLMRARYVCTNDGVMKLVALCLQRETRMSLIFVSISHQFDFFSLIIILYLKTKSNTILF